jgi:hypothetical protein
MQRATRQLSFFIRSQTAARCSNLFERWVAALAVHLCFINNCANPNHFPVIGLVGTIGGLLSFSGRSLNHAHPGHTDHSANGETKLRALRRCR